MNWNILDTGTRSAHENMSLDQEMLHALRRGDAPILRLYDWRSPSITYGYFIKPAEHIKLQVLQDQGFDISRRPTGGGIVFHHADFTFSLLVPADYPGVSAAPVENYRLIHRLLIPLFDQWHQDRQGSLLPLDDSATARYKAFCMAHPSQYDLLYRGRKAGGAAQRRTREGFLHQGSICLALPREDWLEQVLMGGKEVAQAMRDNSYPLAEILWPGRTLDEVRATLRRSLRSNF